jgi:hypothetical protein
VKQKKVHGFTPVKQKKVLVSPRWNKRQKQIPLGRQGKLDKN